MSKVKLWYLYDFANSFASSVIIFFFPLLLSQGGASDTWIGISTAISTAILLLFYPALGRKADMNQKKKMMYIQISSFFMLFTLFVIGIITNFYSGDYTLLTLFLLCALYIVFQISFQGSYVFYSSYMQRFQENGYNKDKVSSLGMGLGQLGNAVSIGIMGAFVVGSSFAILGISDKSLALLLGGTIFIVLSIPFLMQKPDDSAEERVHITEKRFSLREFSKKIFGDKKVFYYLLGYMFVADSISTLQIYITLYLKNVFDFTDKMSSLAGVVSLGMLFATCMVLGSFAHKVVDKRRMLAVGGIIYVSTYLLFGFVPSVPMYAYMSLAFAGVAYGLFFPLARSIYSDIVPKESQAEYFSSFVIFERAAVIVGPITWVIVFELLGAYPIEYRYRANVIVLSFIASLGLYLIKKSYDKKSV